MCDDALVSFISHDLAGRAELARDQADQLSDETRALIRRGRETAARTRTAGGRPPEPPASANGADTAYDEEAG
ncbi:MAG TPA: hypothetical protein VM597_17665 [Gemmataceae bacterium]|nr:hypothetical protein [Gemmataceae bacterium]